MEDIGKIQNVPNLSHPLAGLIAHSLAKLRGPQREASSPKFRALCQTLRSLPQLGDARRVVVFSEL